MKIKYATIRTTDYLILSTHSRKERVPDYYYTDKILERMYRREQWGNRGFNSEYDMREYYRHLTNYERELLKDELRSHTLSDDIIIEDSFNRVPYIVREREYMVYDVKVLYSHNGIMFHKIIYNFRPYLDDINKLQISGFIITYNVNSPEIVIRIVQYKETIVSSLVTHLKKKLNNKLNNKRNNKK